MERNGYPRVARARIPELMLNTLDQAAHDAGMSHSAYLRFIIASHLAAAGRWPPAPAKPCDCSRANSTR